MRNSIRTGCGHRGFVGHAALNFEGASRGIDGAGELDQHAIAGGLDDASAMLNDFGIGQRFPERLSERRAFLVGTHQAAVAGDIRRQIAANRALRARCSRRTPAREINACIAGIAGDIFRAQWLASSERHLLYVDEPGAAARTVTGENRGFTRRGRLPCLTRSSGVCDDGVVKRRRGCDRRYYAARRKGDVETLISGHLDPDAVLNWQVRGAGCRQQRRREVVEHSSGHDGARGGLRFYRSRHHQHGLSTAKLPLVHSRVKIRFVPRDRTFTADLLNSFHFRDGKIVELLEFADTALIRELMSPA